MKRECIYLNGEKSVSIERDGKKEVTDVYIDSKKHEFKENDDNQYKLEYAIASKRKMYSQFLNNQFENLAVLTGAGASFKIGKTTVGHLMSQLWDEVENKLTKDKLIRFCVLVKYKDKDGKDEYIKNLEKLLSLANIAKYYVEDNPKKGKVTSPRVKIYTLNYDTLFEQAGRKSNFTIIDGFSFSIPRTFSGRNFDYDIVSRSSSRVKEEDNFIQKVFHLYKPHGSVDWERIGNDILQKENVTNPLMIFPKDSKYESSYEQPYFEMLSRFQQNLRSENVLLICIGFSFNDKHIVTTIIEALEQNPSFQLMVVNKGIDNSSENFKPFYEAAKKHNNITLVDEEFVDFARYYPDLKSYNQEDTKKIIINNILP